MEQQNARVNITIEVDNNGQREQRELPLKLLMLSHFSGRHDICPISQRKKYRVNANNFNQVLAALEPTMTCSVQSQDKKTRIPITLKFQALADFRPENLIKQVPHLSRLLAMRHLLKDLKANLVDNPALQRALKEIGEQPQSLQQLKQDVAQLRKK